MQGVKRGIMEIADLILVNKADGDLRATATRTVADYAGALRLLRKRPQDPEGFPKALAVSAAEGAGIGTAWAEMQNLAQWRREVGIWEETRATQAAHWFETELRDGLLARLREDKTIRAAIETRVRDVAEGKISPDAAAAEILGKMAP